MPRRGENIYKRKDGRWEGRYAKGYGTNGKVIYGSVYSHSYNEAKKKLRQHTSDSISNTTNGRLLSDYSLRWLKSIKTSCKTSTYNKYKSIYLLHIMPVIGNYRVDFIENKHIEKTINESSSFSPKTQNDIICVIKMILEYASNNGGRVNVSMKAA